MSVRMKTICGVEMLRGDLCTIGSLDLKLGFVRPYSFPNPVSAYGLFTLPAPPEIPRDPIEPPDRPPTPAWPVATTKMQLREMI